MTTTAGGCGNQRQYNGIYIHTYVYEYIDDNEMLLGEKGHMKNTSLEMLMSQYVQIYKFVQTFPYVHISECTFIK